MGLILRLPVGPRHLGPGRAVLELRPHRENPPISSESLLAVGSSIPPPPYIVTVTGQAVRLLTASVLR